MSQQQVTADAGRLLFARAMLAGIPADQVLAYFAVGTGPGDTAPDKTAVSLVSEIGRKLALQRSFAYVDDATGTIGPIDGHKYSLTAEPTNFLYLLFEFRDDEAVGNWSEAALFGGDVRLVSRQALLVDGSQAGDDRANRDVALGGTYNPASNQTLTITVTTGGGSGIAEIGWASSGSEPPGSALVTFGTQITIGTTGLVLTFSGGADGQLTAGDQWQIRGTAATEHEDFGANGVYEPNGNEDGQVASNGTVFGFYHQDPPVVKGMVTVNVPLIVQILNEG